MRIASDQRGNKHQDEDIYITTLCLDSNYLDCWHTTHTRQGLDSLLIMHDWEMQQGSLGKKCAALLRCRMII